MINARFSEEMLSAMKDMPGNVFCSFECGNIIKNETYGNFQINLDDFSLEFLNEVHEIPFYDSTEDVSFFTCKKKLMNRKFSPYCAEPAREYVINEKILSVEIVSDFISVNNGEYEIIFDMAIIIQTNQHKYIFSRGWFFGETITISVDKSFNDIYPIEKVIEDWADSGENEVIVKRTVERL